MILREEFGDLNTQTYTAIEPLHLLNLLDDDIEADMEIYGSHLDVDYMEAYYKTALWLTLLEGGIEGIEEVH
ncbi:hypothetical protein LTR17_024529 [Elasticomyces elasticus]|nr:hypothetical protein LTR17_024529 [Elasticomyces elasticus]